MTSGPNFNKNFNENFLALHLARHKEFDKQARRAH